MPQQYTYPSAAFPGNPRIRLDVPDHWEPLIVPGVQIAVAQPRVEGRFRANVVVTVQRFAPGFGIAQAEAGLAQRKAELPELEELGTGQIEVGGRTWVASEYGYTQPGRPTVVQAARYAVIPRGESAVDVIELVGSCGADSADAEIEQLRAIQDSVAIEID
ncbi:hypothetical protein [Brachybacterium phenoliresistens]|uniref:hypothetical protein n=1 Tax=Brachybacterium phenoliresistens TaxID=396014 RepID=UPI0031D466F9